MAAPVTIWRRPADASAVEQELTALWAEIGREQPIARAMMSNLVIMKERPTAERLDLTAPVEGIPLEEVARRHPVRLLVLHHVRDAPANCPPIAAAVSVMTFGQAASRYGIETIAIESFGTESSLPSIVRRLTIGDLPTTLWWTDDLSQAAPHEGLTSMARQLLFDSRQWRDPQTGFVSAARLLASDGAPDVADLNWRRLSPLRGALASIVRFRPDVLDAGFEARLLYRPGEGALAQLLAGWIAARMHWPADRWPVHFEESRHADDVVRLTLSDGRGGTVTAVQNGGRVLVRDARVGAPIVLPVPHETTADAVATELATLGQDVCLRDALRALAGRRD